MPEMWMPGAQQHPIGNQAPTNGGPSRVIWHITSNATTDGFSNHVGWFTGGGAGAAPTLLWHPYTGEIAQFFPADSRALSVRNAPDGTQTNRSGEYCIQIEICFTSGLRSGVDYVHQTPLVGLDQIMDWLRSLGIADTWPGGEPTSFTRDTVSMTTWNGQGGHYGHNQVPGNDHVDPGPMPDVFSFGTGGTTPPDDGTRQTHTVVSGDTLWQLSQTYGVTVDEIKQWNGLTSDTLEIGWVLYVEAPLPEPEPDPDPVTHVVTEGQTLFEIAALYGVTVEDLIVWNNLGATVLVTGSEINVAEPETPPEPEPEPVPVEHTVAEGNTLSGIATTYGVTVDQIAEWNALIPVGKILVVGYTTDPTPEPEPQPDVFPGEEYFSNAMEPNDYILRAGQMLVERGGGRFYNVGPDRYWNVADEEATNAFKVANGLDNNTIIGPATWDLLVNGTGVDIPPAERLTHTVVSGDTLWELSQTYGVTVDEIKQWNELTSDTLEIGWVLYVEAPTGGSEPEVQDAGGWIWFENARPGTGETNSTLIVQKALKFEFPEFDYSSGPGIFGPLTTEYYSRWQERLGYTGSDADGIPGRTSMEALASKYHFEVRYKSESDGGTSGGRASSPVPGYSVTFPFGADGDYAAGYHTGDDYAAPAGTPVVAVLDGTIAWANGNGGAYGNWLGLRAVNGRDYVYCHLSGFSASAGDSVVAGETIGFVGSTGNSTGPHLHFEDRPHGGGYGNVRDPQW